MSELVGVVAGLACALFAGAAVYINLVEHPARMSCGTELAARQWAPSYERATVMQVSLAVLATLSGIAQWLQGGSRLWLWGSVCILAVIPFTLVVILPVNKRLQDPQRDLGSEETRRLLVAWGRLHAFRSLLSMAASLLFLHGLSRS